MQTGFAGLSSMPDDLASKRGFVALQRSFGESVTDPLQIAIAGDVSAPRVGAAIAGLERRLRDDGGFGPSSRRDLPQRRFALVSVPFAKPAERYTAIVGGHADILYEQLGDYLRQLLTKRPYAAEIRAFDATVVIVSLSARAETSASRLVGSYLTETDPPRGAALAVLNATNRMLGNYLVTR